MNRSDQYYAPAEIEYRRQRAARAARRSNRGGRRWSLKRGGAEHRRTDA